MKENSTFRVALVIKTDGLQYDDRVRKEILTIRRLYPNVYFKIFVMLPENNSYEGVTDYGVPYHSVYIPARDKYQSGTHTFIKGYQFYRSIIHDLDNYDAIWASNVDTVFVPLLAHNKRILWDLHELPSFFLGNYAKKIILKYIFNRCKIILHANPQRKQYLTEQGVITNKEKHYALRNYPDFNDYQQKTDSRYEYFLAWKRNRDCVYLQGLTNDSRAAYESIVAVLKFPGLVAVVIGTFDPMIKEKLCQEYGEMLEDRILFMGKIPQMQIPSYVKQCYISLVFYKNVRPNNYFCEANRFYQSVVLGLPVVVGNNPSMRSLVQKYGLGVSIEDDGNNISKICNGIQEVVQNYDLYHHNNMKYRDNLCWSTQDNLIQIIMNKLIN